MIDSFGRNIDYIRISVTDRCNLRCVYCMPEDGVEYTDHNEILTYEEILRMCKIFVQLGISKFKITGGEPLTRFGVSELISQIKNITGVDNVTLTTNAVEINKYYDDLVKAGIDSINISLNTLDKKLYAKISRRDILEKVKDNIEHMLNENKIPFKINCVPMCSEQNLTQVALLAKDHNIQVRFIEMMPIGNGKDFDYISREETMGVLEKEFGKLVPDSTKLGNGPAEYYSVEGFKGKIGFISAVSHKFCSKCNRIRLTPPGFLKNCLQYDTGADLKILLRNNSDDEKIRNVIMNVINEKPLEHHFNASNTNEDEQGNMFQIGG